MDASDENFWRINGAALRPRGAVLRATGGDALAFLQGQFTQDLRPAVAAPVSYGLWLNQKGRVIGDSQVLRCSETELWISSDETPGEVIRGRLEAYIIADDVELHDLSAEWDHWVLAGAAAAEWSGAHGLPLPDPGKFVCAEAAFVFPSRLLGAWELLVAPGHVMAPERPTLSLDALELARIVVGAPAVPRDIGPSDLAAEGGLEREAISFTKGCYLGQEVVARLHAMGRVRRQLMRLRSRQGAVPPPRAQVFQGERLIGDVRSAAGVPDGGWYALAMITLAGFRPDCALSLAPGDAGAIVAEPLAAS